MCDTQSTHDTRGALGTLGSVVVFGSLNMDLAIESDRMPLEGETLPGRNFLTNPGGKGANQAVAAAKSGARTYLIGAAGSDVFGDQLVSALAGYGVRCDALSRREDAETGVAVVLRSGGDNRIILSSGANATLAAEDVARGLDVAAKAGDVFLTQLECDHEATFAAIRDAHKRGLYTIVNVAPPRRLPADVWPCIDLVCVNETECEAISGIAPTDEPSLARALEEIHRLGARTVVITLGGRGSVALREGQIIRADAVKVDIVDTTAAGDTYLGVLAAAHVSGLPLEEAMRWASRAAGITASRVGAQQAIPTAVEVDQTFGAEEHL